MQIKNRIAEFLDFLYQVTLGAGVPIIRTAENGKAINPYIYIRTTRL